MTTDLIQIKKVFMIGIGGIGISALARLFASRGVLVSGINDEKTGMTIETLQKEGVEIVFQDDWTGLPEADLYVYSDAWIYRGPEIIESAKKTGKPVLSYFEALGIVAKDYKVIAISGVHGKTTTTAMVAEVLIDAGLDPTVIVGSFVKKFESNFRSGKSGWLLVEADEYMRHFLNFQPTITVITNIEVDHLDYYKDLEDIKDAFASLIKNTSQTVIYNTNDLHTSMLIQNISLSTIDYSKYLNTLPKLKVPGEHNRLDAGSAKAVGVALQILEEKINESLSNFAGTWRRLEKRGKTESGTIIYDDYAHHPTEVRASLQALREIYPKSEKRIVVIFQPHLYSRTKALFNDFINAFDEADTVGFLPIYFAREDPDPSVSSEKLASEISKHKENIFSLNFEEAENYLQQLNLGGDDVIVTMGAGEAYKVADKMLNGRDLV